MWVSYRGALSGGRHVLSLEEVGTAQLAPDCREPTRRPCRAPARHRHHRPHRRTRSPRRPCHAAGLRRSLLREVMLLSALDNPEQAARLSCKRIGGPLLFGRLWERLGIGAVLEDFAAPRAFAFALERAVFVATLHRLFVSGSDRDCASWMQDYAIPGSASLSPPCTGFSSRARTATARRGCRTMPSRAARACPSITSTAPWRGSGRSCPRSARATPRPFRRALSRTRSRRPCLPADGTCSPISRSCSW